MSTPRAERKQREIAWFALALSWIAGYVNAVAFLQLAHADVSHMTGDTVQLGTNLIGARLGEAALLLTPIPIFVLGVMLGVAVFHVSESNGIRSPLALVLGAELALLSIYWAYATAQTDGANVRTHFWWQITLLIALPTVAMALQTSIVQQVAGRRVRTTYITGMLSDLAEDVVDLVAWFRRRTRGRNWRRHCLALRVATRRPIWLRSFLLTGIWLCFLIGALCGAYAEARIHATAVAAPVVVLAALGAIELRFPTQRSDRSQHGPS